MFSRVQKNSKGKRSADIFKDESSNPKTNELREASVLCSSDHQTNSSGLETHTCLETLIKLLKMRTCNYKAFFFCRKAFEMIPSWCELESHVTSYLLPEKPIPVCIFKMKHDVQGKSFDSNFVEISVKAVEMD